MPGAVGTRQPGGGGSAAAPRKQEHPQPGAGEQGPGSPQKEPEPRGSGSPLHALGHEGAAFAAKKGFEEFGLPWEGGASCMGRMLAIRLVPSLSFGVITPSWG